MTARRLLIITLMYLAAGSLLLWIDGSRSRALTNDDSDQPALAALDRPIPELNLKGVPLDRALSEVSGAAGVPIVPRWDLIDAAQIPRNAPITLRLSNVSVADALSVVLDLASPDRNRRLGYAVVGNAILVTNAADAEREQIVHLYDVRGLAGAEQAFDPPPPPQPIAQQTGGTLLPTPDPALQGEDDLGNLIESVVDSDSWKDNSGWASIRAVRGGLLITTSPEIHRHVARFLRELRTCLKPPGYSN